MRRKTLKPTSSFNIHPKGVIPLAGCVVTATQDAGVPFSITVRLEDLTGDVMLAADSQEEQNQWVEILQDSGKVTWRNALLGEAMIQSLEAQGLQLTKEKQEYLDKLMEETEELRVGACQPGPGGGEEEELSQEKCRTLELLGVKQQEEESRGGGAPGGGVPGGGEEEGDLLQDLRHIEEQMKALLREKDQAEAKLRENEHRSQAHTLQQSLAQLTADMQQTEAELQSRVQLEHRLQRAEEALQGLEHGLGSLERSSEREERMREERMREERMREERMRGDVTQLRKFFEECICVSEIESKLPAIMKNAVYLHKATARRIKSCRDQSEGPPAATG
ncbi:hypothetical protein NHX12_019438 [Muraenolepis orangiensis]|uniref:PH domain-containing protein n=1 Tax=Muraenolepis orangiensis TaxID=630683 RepID=A0A9Q0EWR2_9TELE|nr:hypothetical protein NHX12_019438 [Muraenolepis orangiensis]